MRIQLQNPLQPNKSRKMQQFLLLFKGFIATISVGSYIQDNTALAFWFLVGGAGIDFLAGAFSILSDDGGGI